LKPAHIAETEDCQQISQMLSRIGDKWSMLVVTYLGEGGMRFSELRRGIGNISQKMLTTSLRNLERDGFVKRTVLPTSPPRVDYELTDLGRELLVPVAGLADWTRENVHRIETARKQYDLLKKP
tara:strand:+ start:29874 stop:30245 length:372 start_codon:yes stop_codon:yes gene_type:complete